MQSQQSAGSGETTPTPALKATAVEDGGRQLVVLGGMGGSFPQQVQGHAAKMQEEQRAVYVSSGGNQKQLGQKGWNQAKQDNVPKLGHVQSWNAVVPEPRLNVSKQVVEKRCEVSAGEYNRQEIRQKDGKSFPRFWSDGNDGCSEGHRKG